MLGGAKRRKHQQRSTRGGAAQQCLKRLIWIGPLEWKRASPESRAKECPASMVCGDRFALTPSGFWVLFMSLLWRMCDI